MSARDLGGITTQRRYDCNIIVHRHPRSSETPRPSTPLAANPDHPPPPLNTPENHSRKKETQPKARSFRLPASTCRRERYHFSRGERSSAPSAALKGRKERRGLGVVVALAVGCGEVPTERGSSARIAKLPARSVVFASGDSLGVAVPSGDDIKFLSEAGETVGAVSVSGEIRRVSRSVRGGLEAWREGGSTTPPV